MPQFLPIGESKWTNCKNYELNKCSSRSSKSRVLKVDFHKEQHDLYKDYTLATDKIKIKTVA